MSEETTAKVLLKFQDRTLNEVPLDKDVITIGRKPNNTIQIDNLAVSGYHAKIYRDGKRFIIEDMGSLNGTFVNSIKISKHILNNNDSALIGKHILSFVLPEKAEDVEKTIASKNLKVDETMVLDSQLQQKILSGMPGTKNSDSNKEAMGSFRVVEGNTDIYEYELKDRVVSIGKGYSADIRLKGFFAPKVSALVNRRKEGYFINPVGGATVKINGDRIGGRYDLKDGDIVEIGKIKLQFSLREH
jgi:pSer/pThr/pTyr-binding forkhead associated (FHA) protein